MKFLKIFSALVLALLVGEMVNAKDFQAASTVADVQLQGPPHDAWDVLVKKYVSPAGKVNYKGFKQELGKLDSYLNLLEKEAPSSSWSRNETMAYWINAYNAYTVKLILDNYPLQSITKLEGGKPWDKRFITIAGKAYSLNDIEHKILRPTFKDPRIHFAVNCASTSCPKLLNEAYMPSKLENQLNKQTRSYLNNQQHNKLEASRLQLSQIFNWYRDDFEAKGGVATFVNKYTKVEVAKSAEISYLTYDWSLNE